MSGSVVTVDSVRAVEIEPTPIDGLLLIRPKPFVDERGFFVRTMTADVFGAAGIDCAAFVQANQSRSSGGVLRGIHLRSHDGEAKTVRCARGTIFDVAVDCRPSSPTFGQWWGCELSDENHLQLYFPHGVGHGFYAVSDVVDVCYQHTEFYDPAKEIGIFWNDPAVGIAWPLRRGPAGADGAEGVIEAPSLSARDGIAPTLAELRADLAQWF